MQAHDAMLPNGPPPSQERLPAPPRSASHLPPTAEEVGGPVPVRGARTSVARWAGALCKSLAVRPLPMMVGGLALVVLDFRTEALDLLPDIVGWALIAVAAWRLALRAAACLAVAAGTASLADAWLPYRYVRVDPTTGERVPDGLGADLDYPLRLVYDDISGWRLAAVALAALLAGLALWTLLAGLGHLARSGGRAGPAGQLRMVGWLVVALWTVPYLGAVANAVASESGAFDPVWNGGLVYVWLVALALFAYLVVLLLRESGQLWTSPVGSLDLTPWEERQFGGGGPTTRD